MTSKKQSTASRNAVISEIMHSCLKFVLSPLGRSRRDSMLSVLAETIIPTVNISTKNNDIKFWGFGGWSLYRGRSILEKEPLTINWIDSFEKDSIFWDIGANIGTFSIYAAAAKGITTYAFEPSIANMNVLCKNIELNKVDNIVTALPIAFSDKTKIDCFNMTSTSAGNTGGQFSQSNKNDACIFRQSCIGFSIDDFIQTYKPQIPSHIKIDVDGIEIIILKGAERTLTNKIVKSILLEANLKTKEYTNIKLILEKHGFKEQDSEPTVRGCNRDHLRNIIFVR